jgi:hypothetical protein
LARLVTNAKGDRQDDDKKYRRRNPAPGRIHGASIGVVRRVSPQRIVRISVFGIPKVRHNSASFNVHSER